MTTPLKMPFDPNMMEVAVFLAIFKKRLALWKRLGMGIIEVKDHLKWNKVYVRIKKKVLKECWHTSAQNGKSKPWAVEDLWIELNVDSIKSFWQDGTNQQQTNPHSSSGVGDTVVMLILNTFDHDFAWEASENVTLDAEDAPVTGRTKSHTPFRSWAEASKSQETEYVEQLLFY